MCDLVFRHRHIMIVCSHHIGLQGPILFATLIVLQPVYTPMKKLQTHTMSLHNPCFQMEKAF